MNGLLSSPIDTAALLTILGIVAAVWAVVPSTAKLTFRLCLTGWDWFIIWITVLLIHVLVFEAVFRALQLYPELGPWRWGLDKNGAVYLLFLTLALFIFARTRRPRLSLRKLPLFQQLVISLLHTRKFGELGELLDRHFDVVLDLVIRDRENRHTLAAREDAPPRWKKAWLSLHGAIKQRAERLLSPSDSSKRLAREITRTLMSSRELVSYLALAHPYRVMAWVAAVEPIVEEYQDTFFEALIGDESSVFFSEIKNSENLAGIGHRIYLRPENELLNHYLQDVRVAGRHAVYRSVAEAVLARIDADETLIKSLNGPLLSYREALRWRCPVFCGLYFFRTMILEGLHQGTDDHLWLHYLPHFADRILQQAREVTPEDENEEFPSPFAYLLVEIVSLTMTWIEEAREVYRGQKEIGEEVYISFEAAEALGGILPHILKTPRLTRRVKIEVLEMILRAIERVRHMPQLGPLVDATYQSILQPYGFPAERRYLEALRHYLAQVDPPRRHAHDWLVQAIDALGAGR